MPCVQLMRNQPRTYCIRVVGRARERTSAVQYHCMKPSRISAKPSEAAALTSGSRFARGGPRNQPYTSVSTPPNRIAVPNDT